MRSAAPRHQDVMKIGLRSDRRGGTRQWHRVCEPQQREYHKDGENTESHIRWCVGMKDGTDKRDSSVPQRYLQIVSSPIQNF